VDAHCTRGLDCYGQISLWPPKCAHEWPVQAAWLRCGHVWRTLGVGFHPPHPVVASWTHTVRVVWTSIARYCYGQPSSRTNGQCNGVNGMQKCWGDFRHWFAHTTPAARVVDAPLRAVWASMARYLYGRPGTRTNGTCKRRDGYAEVLAGPPASVCTHHNRLSRRGRTPFVWFGLLLPDTAMANLVRARMASASGVVGMQKRWGDLRRRFSPVAPGGPVVDAHRTRGLDFNDQILLWLPKKAHEWPVQAAWLGR